ncbi:replication initiator protein [Microviridae sp.]|nr:replication initiator protein [Microviridae sp.]
MSMHRTPDGVRVVGGPLLPGPNFFQAACGQCMSCRLKRSRDWAVRCIHEAQLHERNSFLTLTYDPASLPPDGGLKKSDFQKFLKRVRKTVGPVRYFHCGEYGEQTGRPHYHAAMFGQDFREDSRPARSKSGERAWTSDRLSDLWPHGIHQVGDLTFDSAAYVARYVTKKLTGPMGEEAYQRVDELTGELNKIQPPYVTMSLKPGIGADWLKRFRGDVYPRDYVVAKGMKLPPPKYYDKLQEALDEDMIERLKEDRIRRAEARGPETPERRRVRDECVRDRLSTYSRDPG